MKNLTGWAVAMVTITTAVYHLAVHFGASQEIATLATFAAAATFAFAAAAVAAAFSTAAAAVAAAAVAAAFPAAAAVAAAAVAAGFAFVLAREENLKYRWVLLVLLVEGLAIYAGIVGIMPIMLTVLVCLLLLREVDAAK